MAQKDLTFAEALKLFSEATANSMKYAKLCAMMALRHFAEHGNLTYCQQFHDAMPVNYVRRVAYLKWLAAHAPVTMEKGKLLKDTSDTANELDLDGAEKKPFWDFAPDTEAVAFGPDDVLAAIKAIIKKFENPKRSTPKDDLASAAVVSLKQYAETKAPKAPGNIDDETVSLDGGDDEIDDEAEDAATNEGMAETLTINDLGGVQELAPVDQEAVEAVAKIVVAEQQATA